MDGHIYGTLSYNRKSRTWTIKAEPCVTELAKRLFPGCDGRGRGVARFTAHRRVVGDLNWLMLRYPLQIAERDRERWEEALAEAREYAVRREAMLSSPQTATPPPGAFAGELLDFQKQGLAFCSPPAAACSPTRWGWARPCRRWRFSPPPRPIRPYSWCRRT